MELLQGRQALVFHNLCTVYVEAAPEQPLWVLRFDSPDQPNGGHTAVSRDREGEEIVMTDLGHARKSGLQFERSFLPGESFLLVEPLGLAVVDAQEGLERIQVVR